MQTTERTTGTKDRIEARFENARILPLISRHLVDCRGCLELTGCDLLGIRLKPGVECAGHLDLTFRVRATGEEVSQTVLVYLTDLAPRPALDRGAVAAYGALDLPIRAIETELPEITAVLVPAVLDPGLPHLAEAVDRESMKRHLMPSIPQIFPSGDARLTGVRWRLISHTPGARATIRYRLWVGDSRKDTLRQVSVIGKLNAHRDLSLIMADNHALWQCAADRFQQARPLGTVESLGLSLQEMIEGERLNAYAEAREFPKMLEDVGEALAAFHRAPLPLERTRDAQREITSFTKRSQLLCAITNNPARIERLVGRLSEAVALHCRVAGPVHGDFHHANVMVNDAGVALIDFDEMGLGDPALDAGRFVVSLSVPSLRYFGDLRLLELGRVHFLTQYLERTGIESRRVRIFESAGFIISALTLWRLNRAGGGSPVEELLDLAEAALDDAIRRPPSSRRDAGPRALKAIERRRWATDPGYLAQLIKAAVYRLHGAEIHRVEATISSERGRSLMLFCDLRGSIVVRRWRGKAEGICRPRLSTRAIGRLADHLREVLGVDLDAFAIPSVLGMNQRLGLLLWERLSARKLPIGNGKNLDAGVAHLARALARLHGSGDGFGSPATVTDYLARRGAPSAGELGLEGDERLVPSLAEPRISHFGLAAGRIAICRPDKLGFAPALLAAVAIERDLVHRAGDSAGAHFRKHYLAASGRDPGALDAFAGLADRLSAGSGSPA
jgi:hypothetical protein